MSIGRNIQVLRSRHGLSQRELANIAGVSDKAVSTWELGKKVPRMGAIQKMADYFGIRKSDIIESVTVEPAPKDEAKLLEGFRKLTIEGKQTILSLVRQLNNAQAV